jgi:tetratricopeptide (TPR) repeat protein
MVQIIAKTDGIPLFVEELTKAVMESGILVEDAEDYRLDGPLPPLAIPATLHDSLMARLDRLAAVKEIAQVGAAIGREFSYALLHAVTGRDEALLNSALLQLEDAELLFRTRAPPDVRYSFKHALVRDAAYESLLKSRRQVLHRRIADALRERFTAIAESEPEIVAHHLTQSGLAEAAVEWWEKAAERAMHGSAFKEAIAHLKKASGLAEELPESPTRRLLRARLQTTHGYALLHSRGHTKPETTAAFAKACELAGGIDDIAVRLSAYWGLYVGSFVRGELAPSWKAAEAFMRDAERWPGSLEAAVGHRLVGLTCWFQGDYRAGRAHLEQAVAGYDAERDRHSIARFGYDAGVVAMIFLAWVLWPLGDVDRATRLIKQAFDRATLSGHIPTIVSAHAQRNTFSALRRKRDQAEAVVLLNLASEHELPHYISVATIGLAWARGSAGDAERPVRLRKAIASNRDIGSRLYEPLFGTLLAEAEAEAGHPEAGLTTLDAQLAEIELSGQRWFEAEMHRVRGDLLLKFHPPDATAAEVAFTRAIEIARSQQTRTFELCAALSLAKLYQATGRGEAARELLAPAVAGFTEGPELPEVAEANCLLASLERMFGAA